jgi:hypothetical protein
LRFFADFALPPRLALAEEVALPAALPFAVFPAATLGWPAAAFLPLPLAKMSSQFVEYCLVDPVLFRLMVV